jgi:hypothetical protein
MSCLFAIFHDVKLKKIGEIILIGDSSKSHLTVTLSNNILKWPQLHTNRFFMNKQNIFESCGQISINSYMTLE